MVGRISNVGTAKNGQTSTVVSDVKYHPFGGVKSYTFGNGQTYTRGYDTDGRIASYSLTTATIETFAIGYDDASRISFISSPLHSVTYDNYDNLDRLKSANTGSTVYAYDYDAVGNRRSKTVGANTDSYDYWPGSNRIKTITPTIGSVRNFVPDDNGSTTSDGVNTYTYDPRGRMATATSSIGTTTYEVNALGQRVRKQNSGDALFLYDTAGRLIADLRAAGDMYLYPMDGLTILPTEGAISGRSPELDWRIVAVADFDGDGKADVLWRNFRTGQNYLYPMDGKTIKSTEGYIRSVTDFNWKIVAVGDFNGDGRADVLWRNTATGEDYIYFMNGTTVASEGYVRTVADQNWKVAGARDFDGDGKADIWWRNSSTGESYIYFMDGLTIKSNEGYTRTVADQNWTIAGFGDLNADGRGDVFWRNTSTGENYIYLMNGLTIASEGYIRTVADLGWKIVGFGDFEGDGKSDVLWRHSSSGLDYIYPMDGLTIKSSEGYIRQVYDLEWQVQGVGDFDGDTKADIFWRRGGGTSGSQEYVYLGDIPVAVFADDSPATPYYIQVDHLNTPRLITNGSQQAVWRWDQWEPFGDYPANENPSGLGTFEFPLRFPGQYADKETNLAHNYFRDYAPYIGRYLQSDPIGLAGGLNTYTYVRGNPISGIDALGLQSTYGLPWVLPPDYTPNTAAPEKCEEDDCPDPITITSTSTVCRSGDNLCAEAMRKAGIQGPYFPQTRVYSLKCLLTAGVIKGGVAAGTSAAASRAPQVAANLGASPDFVGLLNGARAVGNSAAGVGVSIVVTGEIAVRTCECSSIRYGPYGKSTSSR